MKVRQIKNILMIVLLMPLLLANKECERSTTWGKKYFSEWEEDHVDIDEDSKCIDCHDDIKTKKVRPSNHNQNWLTEHGGFSQQKFGFKQENVCSLCHAEAQCTGCHQQEEPRAHTEYWKNRGHGIFVSLDRSACMVCHKEVSFCERCHDSTRPASHNAIWGTPSNLHCQSCHFPVNSAGAQECAVCHQTTPSHISTPQTPNNALHVTGADCRDCHKPLRHPDNGMDCTVCHQ